MGVFEELTKALNSTDPGISFDIYDLSVNKQDDSWFFMTKEVEHDSLVVIGVASEQFHGRASSLLGLSSVVAGLTHENACALRKLFPFTAPTPVLGEKRSIGVGDRLGIACPGHILAFKEYDAYPVFAQQSIRELTLTERTYEDVLDCVTFAVFRDGYKDGFGADGDHLKKPEEIEYALGLGFTMITLDCSEHIKSGVDQLKFESIKESITIPEDMKQYYLTQHFTIEDDIMLAFTEEDLYRTYMIYNDAIRFAVLQYETYFADGRSNADFELSIDETATPTSPLQHFFVANELIAAGVKVKTIAPRFCGEFQKGIDYIGDLAQFEVELKVHAAIARKFGYKLSIHSGSDKFSTFELIGKYTRGNFHLKTAGTNWLEAMRTVAIVDPALYREVHEYALSRFADAAKFYHVTTDLNKIPDISTLKDDELPLLFSQNDARQMLHITYGFILTAKDENGKSLYKERLYQLWRENEAVYAELLHQHIGKHLHLLYNGFQKP